MKYFFSMSILRSVFIKTININDTGTELDFCRGVTVSAVVIWGILGADVLLYLEAVILCPFTSLTSSTLLLLLQSTASHS